MHCCEVSKLLLCALVATQASGSGRPPMAGGTPHA